MKFFLFYDWRVERGRGGKYFMGMFKAPQMKLQELQGRLKSLISPKDRYYLEVEYLGIFSLFESLSKCL